MTDPHHPRDAHTPHDDMPPDPWTERGIDLWTLEQAERLTADDVDPASTRWDELDGPTIDEFDNAAQEFEDVRQYGEC